MNKQNVLYFYTMECYLAIKIINIENIVLSQRDQLQKTTLNYFINIKCPEQANL